jgi:hypothetical protein
LRTEFDMTLLQVNMLARHAAVVSNNLDSHDSLVIGFVDSTEIQIGRPGEDMGSLRAQLQRLPC